MNLWARQTGEPPVHHREAMGALGYWLRAEQLGKVATYVPRAPRKPANRKLDPGPPLPATAEEELLWDLGVNPDGS
jgi:hypothetical protein